MRNADKLKCGNWKKYGEADVGIGQSSPIHCQLNSGFLPFGCLTRFLECAWRVTAAGVRPGVEYALSMS